MDSGYSRVLVACIRDGREPGSQEISQLANRIRTDVMGGGTAGGWNGLPPVIRECQQFLTAARVALCGISDEETIMLRVAA